MRWIPRIIGLLLLGVAALIAIRAPESATSLAGRRSACLEALHAEQAEQAALLARQREAAPAAPEQEGQSTRAAVPRRVAADEVCEQMPPLWDEDLALAALGTAAAGLVLLAVGLAMRRPRRPMHHSSARG